MNEKSINTISYWAVESWVLLHKHCCSTCGAWAGGSPLPRGRAPLPCLQPRLSPLPPSPLPPSRSLAWVSGPLACAPCPSPFVSRPDALAPWPGCRSGLVPWPLGLAAVSASLALPWPPGLALAPWPSSSEPLLVCPGPACFPPCTLSLRPGFPLGCGGRERVGSLSAGRGVGWVGEGVLVAAVTGVGGARR